MVTTVSLNQAGNRYVTINSTGTVPLAAGADSIAVGEGALAPLNDSLAIGRLADTTGGVNGIAIGVSTEASALSALACGINAEASAEDAIALGTSAIASATDAVQLSTGTNATANTVQYLAQVIANNFGIQAKTVAVTPTDAANDGTIQVDNVADELYFRSGGAWVQAGSGGGGSTAQSVYDSFTDTNGTALTAHTPDEDTAGNGWADISTQGVAVTVGSATIQNNAVNIANDGNGAGIDLESVDAIVAVEYTPVVGQDNRYSIVLRWVDNNNQILVNLREQNGDVRIQEVVAGVTTTIASTPITYTEGTTYTVTCLLNGGSLLVAVSELADPTTFTPVIISVVLDPTVITGTVYGLVRNTASTGEALDNFTAKTISGNSVMSGGGGETYFDVNSAGAAPTASGSDAIAIGESAVASGAFFPLALGNGADALGSRAIAIGLNAQGTQDDSVVIGTAATDGTGDDCVSIGIQATTSGSAGVAIGNQTNSGTTQGVALGDRATCAGTTQSISIGTVATCSTSEGLAIGELATCSNNADCSIGANSDATASGAIALGNTAQANASDAVQLGTGTNSTASTLQYLTQVLANSDGIQAKTEAAAPTGTPPEGTFHLNTTFSGDNGILSIYSNGSWRTIITL